MPEAPLTAPDDDKAIGIGYYCTKFKGIGGRIKVSPEEFRVEELLNPKVPRPLKSGKYQMLKLIKRGIDTIHACKLIERKNGVRVRYFGMKDSRSVSIQYVLTDRLVEDGEVFEGIRLEHVGYLDKPLGRDALFANRFTVKVRDADPDALDRAGGLRDVKLLNFFGYQRFGSRRPVTHLVGREMVRRRFRKAVETLLCFTTDYESKKAREVRALCKNSRYKEALELMPRSLDVERKAVSALLEGKDHLGTLRVVPVKVRRLFVQAYQSYIFNLTLSRALELGEDLWSAKEGDVVAKVGKWGVSEIRVDGDGMPLANLVGYGYRSRGNRLDKITDEVLKEEGIEARDFFIDELQEVSAQGSVRPVPLVFLDYSAEGDRVLTVKATLLKGSYMTILLRELMKPGKPTSSGF